MTLSNAGRHGCGSVGPQEGCVSKQIVDCQHLRKSFPGIISEWYDCCGLLQHNIMFTYQDRPSSCLLMIYGLLVYAENVRVGANFNSTCQYAESSKHIVIWIPLEKRGLSLDRKQKCGLSNTGFPNFQMSVPMAQLKGKRLGIKCAADVGLKITTQYQRPNHANSHCSH